MAASASVESIGSILGKGMFEIPMYQRPYSWGKDEIETFCDDISGLDKNEHHLLGMIVLTPTIDKESGSTVYQIIDGQQRITTSLIAMSICHDLLTDWSLHDEVQAKRSIKDRLDGVLSELKSFLYDRRAQRPRLITRNENDIERLVLECLLTPPASLDRSIFSKAGTELDIYDGLPNSEKSTSKLKTKILGQWDQRSVRAKKAIKNHALIEQIIADLIKGLDAESKVVFIDDFTTKIHKSLQCVQFIVDTEYNAFKLFETMNDRGLGISAMDLVKNLGLKYVHAASATTDTRAQDFFLGKWKQIFENNLPSSHLLFLRYANNARRPFKKTSEIYQVYRDEVFTSVDAVKGEMNSLEGLSELFRDCWYADRRRTSDPFQLELGLLQTTKTQQWLVIAMSALHLRKQIGTEHDQKIKTILRLVYKLVFIQLIRELGANQFEKQFPAWALLIYQSISDRERIDSVLNDIISKCQEKCRDLGELSPNELKSKKFEKNDVAKTMCYALHMIEGRRHGHDISLGLQLEHIYPQSPEEDSWQSFSSLSEDKRKHLTYSLGNFILLDQSLNPSVGNKGFEHKREAYADNNVVDQLYPNVNSQDAINNLLVFTPDSIDSRSQDMAEALVRNLEEFCFVGGTSTH